MTYLLDHLDTLDDARDLVTGSPMDDTTKAMYEADPAGGFRLTKAAATWQAGALAELEQLDRDHQAKLAKVERRVRVQATKRALAQALQAAGVDRFLVGPATMLLRSQMQFEVIEPSDPAADYQVMVIGAGAACPVDLAVAAWLESPEAAGFRPKPPPVATGEFMDAIASIRRRSTLH